MDLTHSFSRVLPDEVKSRYLFAETRNAAAVFSASNPKEFNELVDVLNEFKVYDADLLIPGGNRGQIPTRLDAHFERLGWAAVRINTEQSLVGTKKKSVGASKYDVEFLNSTVKNRGFEVDNMKSRIAIDVEWNAKDGNLDRDLSAYRALYDFGLIDAAVIITRTHSGIRELANILDSPDAYRRLGTSTTTNIENLKNRMTRGDSGGCPILAVGIGKDTWAGKDVPRPGEEDTTVGELVDQYNFRKANKDRVAGTPLESENDADDE